MDLLIGRSKNITGSMMPTNKSENVLYNRHKRMSNSDLTYDKPSFVDETPPMFEQDQILTKSPK